jgi:hypothetical protein
MILRVVTGHRIRVLLKRHLLPLKVRRDATQAASCMFSRCE